MIAEPSSVLGGREGGPDLLRLLALVEVHDPRHGYRSSVPKAVLLVVAANSGSMMTVACIAQMAGCANVTAGSALRTLEREGLIRIVDRNGPGRRGPIPAIYHLVPGALEARCAGVAPAMCSARTLGWSGEDLVEIAREAGRAVGVRPEEFASGRLGNGTMTPAQRARFDTIVRELDRRGIGPASVADALGVGLSTVDHARRRLGLAGNRAPTVVATIDGTRVVAEPAGVS